MEKEKKRSIRPSKPLREDIAIHIFTASAAMVGVCLTVIGVFQIGNLKAIGSLSDNILAIDALAFLTSCILAYIVLRTHSPTRRDILERIADSIFIGALGLMAAVCFLMAYELL